MSSTYEELFSLIDADGGGTLSLEEVQQFVEKLDLPTPPDPQAIARLFILADSDRSDAIDPLEFTALCTGIKLVIGLSEREMVDAYATHEIKRLFSYLCTHNGATMKRDELRKVIDVLNHALDLQLNDTTRNSFSRDVTEIDFEGFKLVLSKLCPDKSLTSVASAFLMEERRRREHLHKVKSMYEKPSRGGGGGDVTPNNEANVNAKCTLCPAKDAQIESLQARIVTMVEDRKVLERRVQDIGDAAVREMQHTSTIKKLQQSLNEEEEKVRASDAVVGMLKRSIAELNQTVLQLESVNQEGLQIVAERDQLLTDFHAQQAELDALQRDNTLLQERLLKKQEEITQLTQGELWLKQKVSEREATIAEFERRESDVQVKEAESLRMQRLMVEMRDRCDRRERELNELEQRCAEMNFKFIERERELEFREDAVAAMERQVRRTELENQERWETVFRKAQRDLDVGQESLNVRELELVNKEAELSIRERLFESTQKRAESTSLPERERRLKLLQSIELQLSQKERSIRSAERSYLETLIHPEMQTLREENQQLQRQVVSLRVELDGTQNKLKAEVEKVRQERASWIEKSKLGIDQVSAAGQAMGSNFQASRSRRASFIGGGGPPPGLSVSPASFATSNNASMSMSPSGGGGGTAAASPGSP